MTIQQYQLLVRTAKTLEEFLEYYKKNRGNFGGGSINPNAFTEEDLSLITDYAVFKLGSQAKQKDFNTYVYNFMKNMVLENPDNKIYVWKNNKLVALEEAQLKGEKGEKGDRGASNFEVWKSQGFAGTINDFFRYLKGEKGDKGEPGRDVDPATINRINTELSGKVDKVEGKQLSSNDFTNDLKSKLESIDLSTKLDRGGYTGTAKELSDKLDRIARALESNNIDLDTLQELVDYVTTNRSKLEKLGIGNIAGLVQALADKAPLNHNHDDRYKLKDYVPTWNEVQNKPDNLANTGQINDLQRKINDINTVLSQKASTNHSHNWSDINDKPTITKTGNKYTIAGIGGSIDIPERVQLPNWIGTTKPEYNWTEISGKPELDFLPLIGGIVNGNITSNNFVKKDSSNEKVLLGGGGDINLSELKNENIKVGGRNLIKDSNSFNVRSWNYNKVTHKGSTFVTPRGSQYANEATKLTFSGQEWDIFQKILFDESGSYMLSGWVKLETANNLLVVVNNSYSATAIFGKAVITGAGWQKFSIPLNVSGNLQQTFGHIHLGGYAAIPTGEVQSAGDVLLWNLKLEKGNKVTDWSPAPEDLYFYKNNINVSELNSFVLRDTGVYTVDIGGGYGLYLNFKNTGSTSSLEFFKRNWYAETRIGVRNSVDGLKFDNNNGEFRDLAWYEDIHRTGASISSNWTAVVEHQNNTIFVENPLNIELGQLQNMGSISFIKTFDGGNVTFTCAGKTIKYPFDNQFNGKDGSTAVATVYENKCYIRISNV